MEEKIQNIMNRLIENLDKEIIKRTEDILVLRMEKNSNRYLTIVFEDEPGMINVSTAYMFGYINSMSNPVELLKLFDSFNGGCSFLNVNFIDNIPCVRLRSCNMFTSETDEEDIADLTFMSIMTGIFSTIEAERNKVGHPMIVYL